jgi:hypothetical protein
MGHEPKKRSRTWIGALLAALFGGLLILAAYDFCNDTPISELPHHIYIFPGIGAVNAAVLIGSLFGAGLLLIVLGVLALIRE